MNESLSTRLPASISLGKTVSYSSQYDPSLLTPVPRHIARDTLGITSTQLPFKGADLWTGFELSWLNPKGKPMVGILQCTIPVTSPNLVESKSFKLYLNSLNQTKFASIDALCDTLKEDLSRCAGAQVTVEIITPDRFNSLKIREMTGTLIDDLDIEVTQYSPVPDMLQVGNEETEETLVSHLLKSNCLITHQPDWASVSITYEGKKIDHASLLRYLISFREHNEFHEQCVERLFIDIKRLCAPRKLTVYARYTRRGGLDISPFRSDFEAIPENIRHARQ